MPYKSDAQKNFFRGCKAGMKPKGGRKCPPQSVIDKYEGEHHKRMQKAGLHK